jgi:hypothetical protein
MPSFSRSSFRPLFGGAVALAGLALFACSSHEGAPAPASDDAPVGRTAQAYDTNEDLISPTNCTLRTNRLFSCTIAPRALSGLDMTTAVPLRTTFTAVKSGNCSTQYPLQVTLSTDGADDVKFQYISGGSAAVKRKDGQPMKTVTVTDTSPYTKFANFDGSCRISLSVVSNEPDVNSKADAQAIMDALNKDLAAKTTIRDHYQQLSLYHRAFEFMQSVANNFLVELTNDTIQQLRASANDSLTAISTMMGACGDTTLTDQDRQNLMTLFMSLPQLGSADDWQNDGGTPKTLADFLGPQQAQVLATVQKLAKDADGDGGASSYEVDYQNAAHDVVVAQAKVDQAKSQLASWLN